MAASARRSSERCSAMKASFAARSRSSWALARAAAARMPSAHPADQPWARAAARAAASSSSGTAAPDATSKKARPAADDGAVEAGAAVRSSPGSQVAIAVSGHEGIFVSSADDDLPGLLELADHPDDRSLGLLDHVDAHRAEHLHLLAEGERPALGHVLLDAGPDLVRHALERGGEVIDLHLPQHELDGPVVQADDVLEHEHLAPDLFG